MVILQGKSKKTVAFFHNNVLALPDGKVVAVMLGHCVFGPDGKVSAKYFKRTLFSLDGQILAKEAEAEPSIDFDAARLLNEGWELIGRIKDHSCPVIDPAKVWAKRSLEEHFSIAEPA